MGVPVLKTFCFCCNLRTGTLIISVLHLMWIFYLMSPKTEYSTENPKPTDPEEKEIYDVKKSIFDKSVWFGIITAFFEIGGGIFNIIGVIKELPIFFIPWLIYNAAAIVIILVYGFILQLELLVVPAPTFILMIIYALFFLIFATIWGYFFLTVFSYFMELRKKPGSRNII